METALRVPQGGVGFVHVLFGGCSGLKLPAHLRLGCLPDCYQGIQVSAEPRFRHLGLRRATIGRRADLNTWYTWIMNNDTIWLDPQPFEGVTGQEYLAEGAWRFFRRNADNDQMLMDIPIPSELRHPNYRITPIQSNEGWYWSVVDTTKIKRSRSI